MVNRNNDQRANPKNKKTSFTLFDLYRKNRTEPLMKIVEQIGTAKLR